jgi:cell division protein FtsN
MADTHRDDHHKKKSKNRWPILLFIALILGFVVVQLFILDETREEVIADETEELTDQMNDDNPPTEDNVAYREIDEYIVFVSENNPDDHGIFIGDYISSAIDHFTDALEQLSDEQTIALNGATIEQLEQQNEKIEESEDLEKAEVVKSTFQMITQTMESIQLNDSERLQTEIKTLQEMANNINVDTDIEEQDDAVSSFLEQAGIVLEIIENEV